MINPLGLYAMGLASSPDPDVAGRNAVTMYSQGLQQQGIEDYRNQQVELQREEMRRKMEEEALQRQAIAKWAEANGLDAGFEYLPNPLQATIAQSTGMFTTPQQEADLAYKEAQTKKINADLANPAPIKIQHTPAQKSAADINEEQGKVLQKAARAVPMAEYSLDQMEKLAPDLPESGLTKKIAAVDRFFGSNLDMTKAENEFNKNLKTVIIDDVKKLGVNPSNRDLIFITESNPESGVDTKTNLNTIAKMKAGFQRVKEWNNIFADIQNRPEVQQDPSLLPKLFNQEIDKLPPLEELVNQEKPASSPQSSGEKKRLRFNPQTGGF